jgi:hypothetical protein
MVYELWVEINSRTTDPSGDSALALDAIDWLLIARGRAARWMVILFHRMTSFIKLLFGSWSSQSF